MSAISSPLISARDSSGYPKQIMTTTVLRYIHLYYDLEISGKLSQAGLKTMLLGLGLAQNPDGYKNSYIPSPQATELSLLMHGKNQSLHLIDIEQEALDVLDFKQYPIHSAQHFFTSISIGKNSMCSLMKPRDLEKSKPLKDIILKICEAFHQQKFTPHTSLLWNTQTHSPIPKEINDTFDVIVATCSALYPDYVDVDREYPTWIKILSMLKHKGVLYVDSESYEFFENNEQLFNNSLKSEFIITRIPTMVKIDLPSVKKLSMNRVNDETLSGSIHKNVFIYGKVEKGLHFGGGATSHTLYKIERVINFLEVLSPFNIPDRSHFLHYIAKTVSLELLYERSEMIERLKAAEEGYSFASVEGLTPLHVAVLWNNRSALKYFMNQKASNPEQTDNHGMNPKDYARVYQPHLHQEFWPEDPNLELWLETQDEN